MFYSKFIFLSQASRYIWELLELPDISIEQLDVLSSDSFDVGSSFLWLWKLQIL